MVIGRPLRKHKLDGTPYFRREKVETEIQAIAGMSAAELERRADLWQVSAPGYVSSETLLYVVRNAAPGAHREKLTEKLLLRVARRVPSVANADGKTVSMTRMNIREAVRDNFVDLLLSDRNQYDDRLDYYEVNFNGAVAADRRDANDRHWKHENRTAELETEDGEVSVQVESAVGYSTPFDSDELDKKNYRLFLDEAIESLPELQRRIVVMWRQDIPIESNDPSVESISKVVGKSEKTVRTHRDKAFASLKLRLERKGMR
ncbi:RNA polymerase sigma factor [Pigmentiphaga litoralis]|uniref:RNA polymerase sigma factor n=1 Tax=Pigmentiphaga litoralis TaxID=516702 RepID=UPI00389A0996